MREELRRTRPALSASFKRCSWVLIGPCSDEWVSRWARGISPPRLSRVSSQMNEPAPRALDSSVVVLIDGPYPPPPGLGASEHEFDRCIGEPELLEMRRWVDALSIIGEPSTIREPRSQAGFDLNAVCNGPFNRRPQLTFQLSRSPRHGCLTAVSCNSAHKRGLEETTAYRTHATWYLRVAGSPATMPVRAGKSVS